MKFVLTIVVFCLMALFLMVGIVQVMHGNVWLLLVGLLAYFAAFTRYGCASH